MSRFTLQQTTAELTALAARFGEGDDPRVVRAGALARARGHYTRTEFVRVCRWKTPRSAPRIAANGPAAIRRATATALTDPDEALRVAALLSLDGVGFPTASTLLHFAFPEAYPILDVRALETLGYTGSASYTIPFWLEYVDTCRRLAAKHALSLRTLDKALWQASRDASPL
ncbi:MAG: hypothetical protein QOF76_5591 [Solirubrobacteraceae bacterium]|nr:hypothetical protein [Solirubrobacteraceae bacterium]